MMKLSVFFLDVLNVARAEGITLGEAVARVRELGFLGIDIEGCELRDYPEIVKLARDVGMSFANVYGIYDLVNGKHDDAKELIDYAVSCGAGVAMLIPGSFPKGELPDGARVSEEEMRAFLDNDEKSIRALNAIKKTAEYAKGCGVHLTVESYGDRNSLTAYSSEIKWLLDNVPDLSFTFDIGNFYLNGEDVSRLDDKLFSRTVHVHCKDYLTDPPVGHPDFSYKSIAAPIGGGAAPTREVVETLSKLNYDGYLTVEYLYAEDDLAALTESAVYLKGILG